MILLWILVLIIVYIKMIDPGKKRKHPVLNVKYYAHRGFHGEEGIPENSMAAFKKAKGSGYGIDGNERKNSKVCGSFKRS